MKANKEHLEMAKSLGRQGYINGIHAPAQDPHMMKLLESIGNGFLPYLKAWLRGWAEEHNAATPFEF